MQGDDANTRRHSDRLRRTPARLRDFKTDDPHIQRCERINDCSKGLLERFEDCTTETITVEVLADASHLCGLHGTTIENRHLDTQCAVCAAPFEPPGRVITVKEATPMVVAALHERCFALVTASQYVVDISSYAHFTTVESLDSKALDYVDGLLVEFGELIEAAETSDDEQLG